MRARLSPELADFCKSILAREMRMQQGTVVPFYMVIPYSEVGVDRIKRFYVSYKVISAPSFEMAIELAGHEIHESGLSARLRGDILSCAVDYKNVRTATAEERKKHYRML